MSNLCVNPFKILHQSCFFAPGSFREAPGRKAMSKLCVNPFKILHQSCFSAPGSFREDPGRNAASKLCVNHENLVFYGISSYIWLIQIAKTLYFTIGFLISVCWN